MEGAFVSICIKYFGAYFYMKSSQKLNVTQRLNSADE